VVRALAVGGGRVAVDLPWAWDVIEEDGILTAVGPAGEAGPCLRFLWIDSAPGTRDADVHAAGAALRRALLVAVLGRGATLRTLDDGDVIGVASRRRAGRLWGRAFGRNRRDAGLLLVSLWKGRRGDAGQLDAALAGARRL
jgi:hypothetical protein